MIEKPFNGKPFLGNHIIEPTDGSSDVLSLQITLQRRVSCSVVHYY